MIRRPPRSTQSRSSAASDVYKRQQRGWGEWQNRFPVSLSCDGEPQGEAAVFMLAGKTSHETVSYTHLRAHETRHDLVCRLLLEKKKKKKKKKNKQKKKI